MYPIPPPSTSSNMENQFVPLPNMLQLPAIPLIQQLVSQQLMFPFGPYQQTFMPAPYFLGPNFQVPLTSLMAPSLQQLREAAIPQFPIDVSFLLNSSMNEQLKSATRLLAPIDNQRLLNPFTNETVEYGGKTKKELKSSPIPPAQGSPAPNFQQPMRAFTPEFQTEIPISFNSSMNEHLKSAPIDDQRLLNPSESLASIEHGEKTKKERKQQYYIEKWQQDILYDRFKVSNRVKGKELTTLSESLNLPKERITRWFYSRRTYGLHAGKNVISYKNWQYDMLHNRFEICHYIKGRELKEFSKSVDLSTEQITKWFYSKRYYMRKKNKEENAKSVDEEDEDEIIDVVQI